MNRLALSVLALLVAATAAAEVRGAWTANEQDQETLYVNIGMRPWNHFGRTIKLSEFAALPTEAVRGTSATPVVFELRREAGTIFFEGSFKQGDGAGQLTFAPNRNFVSAMREFGFEVEPRGARTLEDELFHLTLLGLSTDYARSMRALFPELSTRDLVRLRGAGVTRAFIDELAAAGYANLSPRDLIRLSASGVDGDFIRKMSKYKGDSP